MLPKFHGTLPLEFDLFCAQEILAGWCARLRVSVQEKDSVLTINSHGSRFYGNLAITFQETLSVPNFWAVVVLKERSRVTKITRNYSQAINKIHTTFHERLASSCEDSMLWTWIWILQPSITYLFHMNTKLKDRKCQNRGASLAHTTCVQKSQGLNSLLGPIWLFCKGYISPHIPLFIKLNDIMCVYLFVCTI